LLFNGIKKIYSICLFPAKSPARDVALDKHDYATAPSLVGKTLLGRKEIITMIFAPFGSAQPSLALRALNAKINP
jgi:hypothetical protein